jgi:beta-phosphoglucomutase-like phosphatase (HAD superfamily)
MMPPEHLDVRELEAFLFDLDGVVTRTASVHATAWKRLFDDYLERRARAEGAAFVPFDPVIDYREYVDGRPREAGVRNFLAARGISLPAGSPDDGPEVETLNGLGNRKDQYFIATLAQHGVQVYGGTVSFVRDARARGVRTAIISSSQNCAAVLGAAGLSQLFDVRVDGIDLRRLGQASRRRTCSSKRPGGSRRHRLAPSSSKMPSSAWKRDVPAGSGSWLASDEATTPSTSGRTVQISSSPTLVSSLLRNMRMATAMHDEVFVPVVESELMCSRSICRAVPAAVRCTRRAVLERFFASTRRRF